MPSTASHPLAALDHLFIGHAISIVLRYEGGLDEERLATALDAVLEGIPPLRHGLVVRDESRWDLEPLRAPPRWLEVQECPRLPEDLAEPGTLEALIPRLEAEPGRPLLAARLTRAPTGSILSVTVSHAVADGYSLFLLLRTWSRAVHGRPVEPLPWERHLLAVEPEPSSVALTPEDVRSRSGFTWGPPRPAPPRLLPASFGTRCVPPEPRTLAKGHALSDNDVLCAWLIQSQAGALAGPTGLAVSIPVDYRRLHGGLPKNYFGNAIRFAPLWLSREVLERETLPELAIRVRESVRSVLDERGARDSLACLERLHREQGPRFLAELHTVDPRAGLLVTNVSHLPFGVLDLGRGPPLHVLLPAVEARTAVIQQDDDGYEVSFNAPG